MTTSDDPTENQNDDSTGAAFRRTPLDRRTMLRRAGMATLIGGGAAALAACSSSGSTATGPVSTAAAPTTDAGSPSSAGSASSPAESPSSSQSSSAPPNETPTKSASASGPTADAAHTVAKSDIPVGSGKIGSDFVVSQPTSGEFKAFTNVCTHQGCLVTKIANGAIACPCHRSMFSIKDGSVISGPAPRPLPAKTATVSGSNVLIS